MGLSLFGSLFMIFLGPVMYTWTETKDLNPYNDLHIFEILFVSLFSISFLITLILLFDTLTLFYFACLKLAQRLITFSTFTPFLSTLKYCCIVLVVVYAYKALMFGENILVFFKMLLFSYVTASLSTVSR